MFLNLNYIRVLAASLIVKLLKKENKAICDNWWRIYLLRIVIVVFFSVILNRTRVALNGVLREVQAELRIGRG